MFLYFPLVVHVQGQQVHIGFAAPGPFGATQQLAQSPGLVRRRMQKIRPCLLKPRAR
jgi:hypothetical protein